MFSDLKIYTNKYKEGFLLSSMGATLTRDTTIERLPTITHNRATALGLPGGYTSGSKIYPRRIRLSVMFGLSEIDPYSTFYNSTIDDLESFLSNLLYNYGNPVELEFTDEEGRFYKAYYKESTVPKFWVSDSQVEYTLLCYDPYIYGPTTIQDSPAPRVIHENDGTERIYPQIFIYGPVVNPVITSNKRVCHLNVTLSQGECVTLDGEERTVTGPSGTNYRPILYGDFPYIDKGEQMFVLVTNQDGSVANARIVYRTKSLY